MPHEVAIAAALATPAALKAVIYRFSGRAGLAPLLLGDRWVISIYPNSDQLDHDLVPDVLAAIADEMLRQNLERETAPVRALILAQVFSAANLLRPDLDGPPPESVPHA